MSHSAPSWLSRIRWPAAALLGCLLAQGAYTTTRAPKPGGSAYVFTSPSGARALSVGRPDVGVLTMNPHALGPQPVGTTPGPLAIHRLPCSLHLELWGYERREVRLPEGAFVPGRTRYPEQGDIALTPRIPVLIPLLYTLRDWPFAALALLPLGALLRRRQAWLREARIEEKLQAQLALGDLGPGVPIGPYRLGPQLGAGGMARVFEATREGESGGERLALKVMSPRLSADAEFQERFRREVNICRALRHRNIVPLLDWLEVGGCLCLVMERLEGQTLAERAAHMRLPRKEVLRIVRQVAEALEHAHRAGIVHRDVKPANIMVTPQGKAVLMDFGIARRADLPVVTEAGSAIGTPAYIAPEQIRGRDIDWRADIYALGITLYELLAGQHPYESATGVDLLNRHVETAPEPLRTVCPAAPEALEALVMRMVAKSPAERADEPGDIARALRALEAAG